VQVPELPAGLNAELVDQDDARSLISLERLCLPSRPIEREHQLPPQALAPGVLLDERLKLADQLIVAAIRHVPLEELLETGQTQLNETGYLDLREGLVRELGQRRSPPQRQRISQPSLLLQLLEAGQIEPIRLHPQEIARRPRLHTVLPEQLPQARHVHLKRLVGGLGRVVLPERVDQAVARNHVVGVQQEHHQQGLLFRAPQFQRSSVLHYLERTEDPELHLVADANTTPYAAQAGPTGPQPAAAATLGRLGT
jgi:hypothetical protein